MATKTLSTVRKATKLQVQRHKAKTLRKQYGVLVGDHLVFQSNDYLTASKFADAKGVGMLVSCYGMTDRDRRKSRREMRDREAMKNPLADKLTQKHTELLEMIHDIGSDVYEVSTSDGIVTKSHWRGEENDRRATNNEAATATIDFYVKATFDLRGSPEDVAASAAASLRQFARDLMAKARTIELASKRGELPKPVKHHYVRIDGETVFGPSLKEHLCHSRSDAWGGEVVRVYEDGTEEVRGKDDTIFS